MVLSEATLAATSIAWKGVIEIATGRGEKGPWRQNESRYDYVDDPTVAIDNWGEVAVAWVVQDQKDVFFQRFGANGAKQLPEPVNVSQSPTTFSWLPRVVFVPHTPQKVLIAWQEIIFTGGSHGGDILFARSEDAGETFSEPINLSNNSLGGDGKGRINRDIWHNGSFDIVATKNDRVYVVWTEYDGQLWFSRSADGGKTFSRATQLANSERAKPARGPALALAPDGALYLAWTVGDDNSADIRVMKSTDGGKKFSEPEVVAYSNGYSDAPKLAVDTSGTLHIVYAESSGGPFDRYHIRYTRSTDGAQTFEPARDISTPLARGASGAGFPSLDLDARDNLYVVWELFPNQRQRPRGLAMSVSLDSGRQFTPPVLVPNSSDPAGGANGSHQGLLMKKLAVNDAGTFAIVNSSLRQNQQSRVWLMRGELPSDEPPAHW